VEIETYVRVENGSGCFGTRGDGTQAPGVVGSNEVTPECGIGIPGRVACYSGLRWQRTRLL
jgi:hypothetical protein